jgi:hypothetical protein
MGYDCVPKTLNFALRCPFFTHREQVVRLINKCGKINVDQAKDQKIQGGVAMSQLKDFAIVGDKALSLERVALFETPPDSFREGHVLDFVRANMIKSNRYEELVIVYHGTFVENFSHAAVFLC